MYHWVTKYKDKDWGAYVVAQSHLQAKELFHEQFKEEYDGKFEDIRTTSQNKATGVDEPGVLLDGDPRLEILHLRYSSKSKSSSTKTKSSNSNLATVLTMSLLLNSFNEGGYY